MLPRLSGLLCVVVSLMFIFAGAPARCETAAPATIVSPVGGSFAEKLAAKEVRRYVYLRTGKLLPIVAADIHHRQVHVPAGRLVVVARKDRPEVTAILASADLQTRVAALPPGGYLLTTVKQADRPALLVVGGDDIGTLYGAYRLAEHWACGSICTATSFPTSRFRLNLTDIDDAGKPLFALRGIQPFHDFPEGPDWWNRDGYKAILGQLPKLGMNFFGLHCYPQGGVGPEPLVWIGPTAGDRPGRQGEGQLSLAAFHRQQRDRRLGIPAGQDRRLRLRRRRSVRPRRLRRRLHARHASLEQDVARAVQRPVRPDGRVPRRRVHFRPAAGHQDRASARRRR